MPTDSYDVTFINDNTGKEVTWSYEFGAPLPRKGEFIVLKFEDEDLSLYIISSVMYKNLGLKTASVEIVIRFIKRITEDG